MRMVNLSRPAAWATEIPPNAKTNYQRRKGLNPMKTMHFFVIALIVGVILPAIAGTMLSTAYARPVSTLGTAAPDAAAPAKAPGASCPMCALTRGADKGMEMSPAMKQHCDMIMNSELSKKDAACILALKQELKLTPEQVQQLEQILKESRQKAVAVLTPEQQKSALNDLAPPESMSAMHSTMHKSTAQKSTDPGTSAPKTLKSIRKNRDEQRAAEQPAAVQPTAEQPAVAADPPAAEQPAAEQPAAEQPGAAALPAK
jgi:hypothetical protein